MKSPQDGPECGFQLVSGPSAGFKVPTGLA